MEGQSENNEHWCQNSDGRKFLPTLNSIVSQVLDEGQRENACKGISRDTRFFRILYLIHAIKCQNRRSAKGVPRPLGKAQLTELQARISQTLPQQWDASEETD